VNALANDEVGKYLNQHFVSSFQKVGSFQIVDGQKQGGNVASYFCTPNGGILDAIAGPVDAATLLREARWVVETRKSALLESHGDMRRYQLFFRQAHADRLPSQAQASSVNWQRLPLYPPSEAALAGLLDNNPVVRQLDQQGKVHALLAVYPLVPLTQAYKVIYEKVLNEKISTRPVVVGDAAPATDSGPRSWSMSPAGGEAAPSAPAGILTADDLRERNQALALRHARGDLPATEVCGAAPLNVLLADLEKQQAHGAEVRAARLEADVLPHLNVTSEADGGPTGGLLKDGGKLSWPLAWRQAPLGAPSRQLRGSLETSLAETIAQARKGQVDGDLLSRLRDDVSRLQILLVDNVQVLTPSAYIEGKRYLDQLADGLKVLGRDDAGQYVDGTFALDAGRIQTVGDLVAFMAQKRLKFAPAVRGDESAYLALHRALAACGTDDGPSLVAARVGDM
jgi:hypothetical protein